jgi:hypothetical protein
MDYSIKYLNYPIVQSSSSSSQINQPQYIINQLQENKQERDIKQLNDQKNEQNYQLFKTIFGHIRFDQIISRRTCYGLIWNAFLNDHECIIKMIMLTTGVHFDKNKQEYYDGLGHQLTKMETSIFFDHDDHDPFHHSQFSHRRSMTKEAFFDELCELQFLSQLEIAPKVYGYGICDRSFDIHYAFIVMEKLDCSLKDILLVRQLEHSESKIVQAAIEKLHIDHGLTHGDLKPSNIGLFLDQNQKIKNCLFFDCQKVKHKKDCTQVEFNRLVERDWHTYQTHSIKNRQEN